MTPAEHHHRTQVEAAVLILLRDAGPLSVPDLDALIAIGDHVGVDDGATPEEIVGALRSLASRGYVAPVWRLAGTDGAEAAERAADWLRAEVTR